MLMVLNESLFEEIKEEEIPYVEEASKSVPDSDGFMTDYTWYTNGKKHTFMFGDSDLYEPDEDYADHEVEIYPGNEENAYEEAKEWFDNYHGFEKELNESIIIDNEDDITSIINYLYGDEPLPNHISEKDVENFNVNQAADYVYYREWEDNDDITLKAREALEISYEEHYGEDEESLTESWAPIVKDSINHLINDLGMDSDAEDFADDVINDIENNYDVDVDFSDPLKYKDWASEIACEVSRQLNECKSINEDFSPTLPKWLINFLLNNKKYKDIILNRMHLDLANMKYVKIPRDEMPANGFHPIMKDNTKQLVYLLRDLNRNIVYFPGINDDTSMSIDPDDQYKSISIKNLSKKQLLDHTIQMGYIERDDSSNFNRDKQNERRLSREGALERGKGQYEYDDKEYPIDPETGRKNYDADPIITKKWLLTKGQDKSGYLVDKDKYKKMLDQADMQTYSRQYERYTKKLETLRTAIINYIMGMSLTKSRGGGWGYDLQYAVSRFEDAIRSFEDLQKSIGKILSSKNLNDEEKNKYIQMEFDGNESFNSISNLRKNIEDAWKYLNNLKDKQLEEELTPSHSNEEDPMAKLAKKHNLDILSPMSAEPGSMRVSGTVRDLDNFYKEAEELGLLNLNESQEFQKIADEVGLIEKDLETFKNEEINPGESELDAIKRYKQELIESGADLSKLRNEALKEALYGKEEFDEFMELANKLGFKSSYQMKHIMNAAHALGKSELEMLKSIDKTFNGKVPDSLIDGLTDTFLIVADEVGIKTDEDYKLFLKYEVEPNETITQAILRYKEEIKDLNLKESQATGIKGRYQVQVFDEGNWHDLNKWSTIEKAHKAGQDAVDAVYQDYRIIDRETGDEVLEESAMSRLSVEIKNLKEEIPELKKQIKDLEYDIKMAGRGGNSDASEIPDIEKEIEELTQSIKEKEDRLSYIEKTYK